jgi:hypothetical protein
MKRSWRRRDPLESRLRAQRPEPHINFLHSLEGRLRNEARRPAFRLRFGLAAALAAAMLVALASFGGLGHAATGVTHVVKAATHVVAPVQHATPAHDTAPLSSAQAQYIVTMCFHHHTIFIDSRAERILLRLGATLGPCQHHRRHPPHPRFP